ncbi:14123_t:CDS:2 [Ambispora leptoticha]|uniref:14123_t:CDS:1 n=1 Tax=Ambispora leptoticha TaxID=144679 RepID=A0A9N9FV53_9GLOM|nr:14123_t:CDS:2 [Ambispora leptoticha]
MNVFKYFLYFTILVAYSRTTYSDVSYNETQDGLIIFDSYTDKFGTILLRMVKYDSITQCTIPGEPRMHLRLIFSNGTVRPLDFDFPVNTWNYCPIDWIFALLVEPNLILLNYYNFSDTQPTVDGVYQENGVFVDYWGNIKNTFRLGFGSPYARRVTVGFIPSDGILRTYQEPNGAIGWNRFTSPDKNGQITDDGGGYFYNNTINEKITDFRAFNLLEGGFGCIIVSKPTAQSSLELQDASFPRFIAYISLLKTGRAIPTKLFSLYRTSIPFASLNFMRCAVVFDGTGNECLIITSMNNTSNITSNNSTMNSNSTAINNTTLADILISSIHFGSQGSITAIQPLDADDHLPDMTFISLFYGGYVTMGIVNTTTKETGGVMLDSNGNKIELWSFGTAVNHSSAFLLNNTLWGAKSVNDTTWAIITKTLPKLKAADADDRYENPNINITFPTIGAVIPSNIRQINITYEGPITLSSGNITIYQEDKSGSADVFRQGMHQFSQPFQINVQDQTVSIHVLDSTFNIPNSTYYVIVDTNFVRDFDTNEALLGIGKESWRFTTEPFKSGEVDIGSQSGIIRLTPEATIAFKNSLKSSSSIYEDILNDLANAIPISHNRLDIKKKYQINSDQILLRITIHPSKNNSEISTKQVTSNLKTLIKYKDITSISRYNYTDWLDSSYGFQESSK